MSAGDMEIFAGDVEITAACMKNSHDEGKIQGAG